MNNWRRSWLSREIVFELIFLFLLALLAVLRWRKAGSPAFIQGILIVTAVAGIVFLFSMSRLYMLRTIPAWQGLNTLLSFFLSALLLGPLFVAIARRVFFQTLGLFEPAAVIASLSAVLRHRSDRDPFHSRDRLFGSEERDSRRIPGLPGLSLSPFPFYFSRRCSLVHRSCREGQVRRTPERPLADHGFPESPSARKFRAAFYFTQRIAASAFEKTGGGEKSVRRPILPQDQRYIP